MTKTPWSFGLSEDITVKKWLQLYFAEFLQRESDNPLSYHLLSVYQFQLQSPLDTWNFKGLGKICRVISSSR